MYRTIQHKRVIFSECVTKVCLVLSLSDRSKCFTHHTLGYLFIPTQIWLLLEAFSHAAITVRRLHSPESCCFLPHYDSCYVVCRLYSVGALLHNCMTNIVICFNLRYVSCPLELQCIRYLTSNVFGSGPKGTLKI